MFDVFWSKDVLLQLEVIGKLCCFKLLFCFIMGHFLLLLTCLKHHFVAKHDQKILDVMCVCVCVKWKYALMAILL